MNSEKHPGENDDPVRHAIGFKTRFLASLEKASRIGIPRQPITQSMSIILKLIGAAVLPALFILGFAFHGKPAQIRYIGVPDGAAGLLLRYVADQEEKGHDIQTLRFEPYTLHDCCAAATGYALGAGRLDMAAMCPDAARALVAKDPRYTIAGPVVENADVLVTRPDAAGELAIAVSQKRSFQNRIVQRRLGQRGRPVAMLHSAVPFAYARGVVQGAVMDITKACDLKGVLSPAAENNDQPMITGVLVVKKALQGQKVYHRFIQRYVTAVRDMQGRGGLLHLLKKYVSADATMGDVDIWQKMNVRFTHPLNNHRQG